VTYERDVLTLVYVLSMTGGMMGLISGIASSMAQVINKEIYLFGLIS
jgi:hypothetical protein